MLMGLSLLVYTLGQRQRASQPKTAQDWGEKSMKLHKFSLLPRLKR